VSGHMSADVPGPARPESQHVRVRVSSGDHGMCERHVLHRRSADLLPGIMPAGVSAGHVPVRNGCMLSAGPGVQRLLVRILLLEWHVLPVAALQNLHLLLRKLQLHHLRERSGGLRVGALLAVAAPRIGARTHRSRCCSRRHLGCLWPGGTHARHTSGLNATSLNLTTFRHATPKGLASRSRSCARADRIVEVTVAAVSGRGCESAFGASPSVTTRLRTRLPLGTAVRARSYRSTVTPTKCAGAPDRRRCKCAASRAPGSRRSR
jgi:hypothetical protein